MSGCLAPQAPLSPADELKKPARNGKLTLILKFSRSSGIIVSALAMTGMRLTRVPNRFMISTSRGLILTGKLSRPRAGGWTYERPLGLRK
jgi:hypothetical protein